jgi:heat shock protein HtpX
MSQSLGATSFYDDISRSHRRTIWMLGGVFILLVLVANLIGGALGLYTVEKPCVSGMFNCTTGTTVQTFQMSWGPFVGTLVVALLYMLFAYIYSSRAALAFSGASRADGREERAQRILENLSIAAGVPCPTLWIVQDQAPNAFATGRGKNNAHVAVTTGLLEAMSDQELEGVLAHELSHILNNDVRVTTVAVLSAALVTMLADLALHVGIYSPRGRDRDSGQLGLILIVVGIALYIVAVPAAMLLKAGLSRQRETLADATAVEITRNPKGLRQALEKLEQDTTVVRRAVSATNHLWIESPSDRSKGLKGSLGRMMNTHPPLEERIATLRRVEGLDETLRGPVDPRPSEQTQSAPPQNPWSAPPQQPWAPPSGDPLH